MPTLTALLFFSSFWMFTQGTEEFCYYEDFKCGPNKWEGICNKGHSQSPIDLPYDSQTRRFKTADVYRNSDYFGLQNFNLNNNGHTVQASIKLDLTSRSTMTGSLFLGQTYVFSQLHFHWGSENEFGSEHTLNKQNFPLELHMVHYSSEYDGLNDAIKSNQSGAVSVLGIFFNISNEDNKALAPIIDKFRLIPTAKTNTTGRSLNLSSFLPKEVVILQYNGSLTTPSCDEVVLWNVVVQPSSISLRQLQAFRKLKSIHGGQLVNNYRPIQRRHSRKINIIHSTINTKHSQTEQADAKLNKHIPTDI